MCIRDRNSWNIGIKPGIAIKLSDHFCLVAKYGFLGYSKKENHGYESEKDVYKRQVI